MQGWVWLLVTVGFFYFMMRFGCGAHMAHGGHGGHGDGGHREHAGHRSGLASTKDPVCGMPVGSGQGYTETYEGQDYPFCSRQCLDKFDADRQRYVS